MKRVAPEKAYLELQPQLQRVVAHVLEECGTMADFGTVFAMEPFMKLLRKPKALQTRITNLLPNRLPSMTQSSTAPAPRSAGS